MPTTAVERLSALAGADLHDMIRRPSGLAETGADQ